MAGTERSIETSGHTRLFKEGEVWQLAILFALLIGGCLFSYYRHPVAWASPIVEPTRSLPLVQEGIVEGVSKSGTATVVEGPVGIPNTSLLVVRLQEDDPAMVGQESTIGALVGPDQKLKLGDRVHWRFVTWYSIATNARDPLRVVDGPAPK